MATALYALGFFLRGVAFLTTCRTLYQTRDLRLIVVLLACGWVLGRPILLYLGFGVDMDAWLMTPSAFFVSSLAVFGVVLFVDRLIREQHVSFQNSSHITQQHVNNQAILHSLAKQQHLDLRSALSQIISADANQLTVARVGVWIYNEDKSAVQCVALYNKGQLEYDTGELKQTDFPHYFETLEDGGSIVANDAAHTPGTHEFAREYLPANDITSMLDTPIRLDGTMVGIVCHEHVGPMRRWTIEESDFAHSIADLCALALSAESRRKMEAELKQREQHLREAQKIARIGSFHWSIQEQKLRWSDEVFDLLGLDPKTIEPSFETFLSMLSESDAENFRQAVDTLDKTGIAPIQQYSIGSGKNIRYFESQLTAVHPDSEEVGYFTGTIHDITERLNSEREKKLLEEQLIQSQKMESIGTLAGGIAHDFNNILTPIMGYTDVAMAQVEKDSPIHNQLSEVMNGAVRAKELVEQILVFGRRWHEEPKPLDMKEVITNALKLVRPTIPSSIEMVLDLDDNTGLVEADATQMQQVLVNLCTNAWHAMERTGGILGINLKPAFLNNQSAVEISISDTGEGIDELSQERIFEPFFTTKEVGRGTGLGLSVVHGIVTKLGGEVLVLSAPGNGATFTILLPTTNAAAEKVLPHATISLSGTILIAHDDLKAARDLKQPLCELGYTVNVVASSQKALNEVTANPSHYKLVISDLMMNGLSGLELAQKIQEFDASVPVIILTDRETGSFTEEVTSSAGRCRILSKATFPASINQAIMEIMD